MENALPAVACLRSKRTWEARKAIRGESRREQQFYRYYGPFRQMTKYGPQYCDVVDPVARRQHKAVSCPDKILTAFCQLGALRLRARRCMIFFFDVNHAYVMAEATKSLSLESDTTHDPGDEIWLGHSVIPRNVACCEDTVNLPSFPVTAAANDDISKSAFVVADLTKHPTLSTRPYVTEFPNGRSYAGVPITTPAGVNIGAYCILDDKVRDGLSESDLTFLRDMSQTVMAHLETVRALSERQQNYRMVTGLGNFVRGAPDAGSPGPPATRLPMDAWAVGEEQSYFVKQHAPDSYVNSMNTPPPTSDSMDKYFAAQHVSSALVGLSPVLDNDTVPLTDTSNYHQASIANDDSHEPPDQRRTDSAKTARLTFPFPGTFTDPPPIHHRKGVDDAKHTYQRAADTLCHSLDVDGVIFLDASVRVFGGLGEADNPDSNEATRADSGNDSAGSPSISGSVGETRSRDALTYRVLGCAQSARCDMMDSKHLEVESHGILTDSFLRRLMRRNPHGAVWTYDENLQPRVEESVTSDESDTGAKTVEVPSSSNQQSKGIQKRRLNDGQILQAAFPGARCIALHGIWDYTRKRWATAALYWTLEPLRQIARDTEMQFVAAFCDVVVAETKRLEVLETDKAKSDFISSVSHELRSPLHGILGSCELLSDHGLDHTARDLLDQIGSCGRTLLDIIEHLLDFAALGKRLVGKAGAKGPATGRPHLRQIHNSNASVLTAPGSNVALDDLTEDTVVSSVYSYSYSKSDRTKNHVPVILDIDRAADKVWNCSVAAGGWKRVCINLVTNALKYTPSGSIHVALKQEPRLGSGPHFDAVFTVSDTGKGMSKQFQNDHLFHDFAQEDSMSDGLGPGLHMVARIVHAMGGKIEVVSDQGGSGTCVTVRVPLEQDNKSELRNEACEKTSAVSIVEALGGSKVGLITAMDAVHDLAHVRTSGVSAMAMSSIGNNLRALGVQSESFSWKQAQSYGVIIVMEDDLTEYLAALRNRSRTAEEGATKADEDTTPVLVLCNNSSSAQQVRDSWATNHSQSRLVVESIALPCGIKGLSRAIASALCPREEPNTMALGVPAVHKEPRNDRAAEYTLRREPRSQQTSTTEMPITNRTTRANAGLDQASLENMETAPITSLTPPATRTPTLLLVDDNSINLKLLTTFAKKHGYPHIAAQDGQLAVEAFERAHKNTLRRHDSSNGVPNVILMDINMPVMDGYEATQSIRAYERQHGLTPARIVAITALQSEAAQTEALGSGFDMFLSKPLKLKDLAKLIEA